MAQIYRNNHLLWTVNFTQTVDVSVPIKAFIASKDRGGYQVQVIERGSNHLTFGDQTALYLRSAISSGESPSLVILQDDGALLLQEKLYADASCFVQYIDFSGGDSFGQWSEHQYEKPADIAVFTRIYNDKLFTDLFCRHYIKLTDPINIFLIDHESEDGSVYEMARKYRCQAIRIPRGFSDESNMRRYCEYFQRFLLTKYKWVIYADIDELLVHENGLDHFKQLLKNESWSGIFVPEHGYEVFHHPDFEPELDYARLIGEQRNFLHPNKAYAKPTIASDKAFWGPGFHYALNLNQRVVPGLWMIHLAHMSVENTLSREVTRMKQIRSAGDKAANIWQPDLTDLNRRRGEIEKEHRDKLNQAHIKLPEWMRSEF
jgi:hypothetical protein